MSVWASRNACRNVGLICFLLHLSGFNLCSGTGALRLLLAKCFSWSCASQGTDSVILQESLHVTEATTCLPISGQVSCSSHFGLVVSWRGAPYRPHMMAFLMIRLLFANVLAQPNIYGVDLSEPQFGAEINPYLTQFVTSLSVRLESVSTTYLASKVCTPPPNMIGVVGSMVELCLALVVSGVVDSMLHSNQSIRFMFKEQPNRTEWAKTSRELDRFFWPARVWAMGQHQRLHDGCRCLSRCNIGEALYSSNSSFLVVSLDGIDIYEPSSW